MNSLSSASRMLGVGLFGLLLGAGAMRISDQKAMQSSEDWVNSQIAIDDATAEYSARIAKEDSNLLGEEKALFAWTESVSASVCSRQKPSVPQ